MSYLIIDLEKPVSPLHETNLQAGKVFLFAKRKANVKLARQFAMQHRAVKVVRVKADEKVSRCIANTLKKILKKDASAGIMLMSKRKKVARVMNRLLNDYPEAEMMLLDKLFLNQLVDLDKLFLNQLVDMDNQTETSPAKSHAKPLLLEKPTPLPLLAAPENERQPEKNIESQEQEYDLQAILNFIKKNRPRKKAALQALLAQQFALSEGVLMAVFDDLVAQDVLKIDAADNIKYLI